jgi:hypothetical protein
LLAKDGALIPLLTAAGEKITATPKDYGLTADGARGGCDEGDGCAARDGGRRGGNLELCVFFLAFVMSSGVDTSLEPRF